MKDKIHIGEKIAKELITQKRSVNWLADEIGCDRSNLNKQLKNRHIHPQKLHLISKALNVDFFACYSQTIIQ